MFQTLGGSLSNKSENLLYGVPTQVLSLSHPRSTLLFQLLFLTFKLEHDVLLLKFFFSSSHNLQDKVKTHTSPIAFWTQAFGTQCPSQYLGGGSGTPQTGELTKPSNVCLGRMPKEVFIFYPCPSFPKRTSAPSPQTQNSTQWSTHWTIS